MQHVGGVDHAIILVRDIDRAERQMSALGFKPTPRGIHSAVMGTANSTVVFADGTYVEILTVHSETPLNASLALQLKKGDGLAGIAFKTGDARAAAADFAGAGIAAGEATDFQRPVDFPGGARDAAFTIARIDPAATPGAWTFVCQHHSPDVVWRQDFIEQPNGVTGLLEVVGTASDLASIETAYRRVFTDRVERDEESLVIRTGTATVRFLSPLAYAERFGRVPRQGEPHLDALMFACRDLDRTAEALKGAGTRFAVNEGSLLVSSESVGGVVIEFCEAG